ncbi:NAD(P)H-hydrate dehydratase [Nitrosophilus kaiyonis]|uniref:NAD(P)H-hydrate dehydratase n=1 Tax=Nitrosophilus kaiyonis TaxID=2930200 RepID=UPI0024900C75|nr:NAD(P)H-hydrate dehydratase [Nitrosophilus kaiyonis]
MKNLYKSVSYLDKRCYEIYNLPEDILMEHAADGINRYIRENFQKGSSILIVAGPGNNGGDGVALARLLLGDFDVKLYMPYGAKSDMCKIQVDRFLALGGEFCDDIKVCDIVVDALFGSGLSKPLKEDIVELLGCLNRMDAFKIAVDIPTGINIDGYPNPYAFIADITFTMGGIKTSLVMDLAKDYVGEIKVVDLGVSKKFYEDESNIKLLEEKDLKLPVREKKSSHKGDYGHLAVIAGEKEGAAIMAALSALNFGAGLVTVVTNEKISIPYELMHSNTLPKNTSAIAVGMGLGMEYSDEDFNELVLKHEIPLVIDADLFYSSKIKELIKKKNIVLTPHPKEFSSLLKILNIDDVEVETIQKNRLLFVEKFIEKYPDVTLVLKGANPIIAKGEKIFINTLGSPALSKGGSGDVLTGLIGALLAQGYKTLDAAINGSLAHTIAANKVKKTNFSLTPDDLIKALGCL